MADRAELEAEWERKGLRGRSIFYKEVEHSVTAPDFARELKLLADVTSDHRFDDALAAITELELVNARGQWRRDIAANSDFLAVVPRDYIFLAIEKALQRNCSLRLACAEAVVVGSLRGHSFDAACKEVERLWRDYRKQGFTAEKAANRLEWGRAMIEVAEERFREQTSHPPDLGDRTEREEKTVQRQRVRCCLTRDRLFDTERSYELERSIPKRSTRRREI